MCHWRLNPGVCPGDVTTDSDQEDTATALRDPQVRRVNELLVNAVGRFGRALEYPVVVVVPQFVGISGGHIWVAKLRLDVVKVWREGWSSQSGNVLEHHKFGTQPPNRVEGGREHVALVGIACVGPGEGEGLAWWSSGDE